MAGESKIVVAIDFGTHGTGWAWMQADVFNDVLHGDLRRSESHTKDNHVGAPALYPKNLTALLLDGDRVLARGFDARQRWLRTRAADRKGLRFVYAFKMLLKADLDHGGVPRLDGAVELASLDRTARLREAKNLTTAYLREVRREVLQDIADKRPFGLYDEDDLGWCLTVPAIWEEADRRLMEAAAVDAGLPSVDQGLLLVAEPEAAAVYCSIQDLHVPGELREAAPLDFKAGSGRFMVVDCGGGTVDITAFRLQPAPDGSPRLDEVGQPDGDKLGSEYLNRAFVDDLVVRRLGAGTVAEAQRSCPDDLAALVDNWEHDKLTVQTDRDGGDAPPRVLHPLHLPIGGDLWELIPDDRQEELSAVAGKRFELYVSEQEIQDLFAAAVDPIVDLVDKQLATMQQLDGEPDGLEQIVLVGGFSRSDYVQQRLRRHVRDRARVVVAADPGVAVMLGAMYFCYRPDYIRSRRMKYSIAVEVMEHFREGTDPLKWKVVDDNGVSWCTNRCGRLVHRGQAIEIDEPMAVKRVPYYRRQKNLLVQVMACHDDDPEYFDPPNNGRLLGQLTVDIAESVGKPKDERKVEVQFLFGGAVTEVRAVNLRTNEAKRTTFKVDYLR